MKIYLLIGTLITSSFSYADLEHKTGQGANPSQEKLSLSRGCFEEIEDQGCGHPRDDHEIFIACLDENKTKLSTSCLSFFETLYGKRN